MSSRDEAARCISQLEAKVVAGAHAKCDVSPDELPAVEAALAQLKDHVMLSHESEALLPERIISLQRPLYRPRRGVDLAAPLGGRRVTRQAHHYPRGYAAAGKALVLGVCGKCNRRQAPLQFQSF